MKALSLTPEEERIVQAFRALGNPARFRILQLLGERQACICGDVVDLLPLAQSTVSGHLKVLKEAGLITGTIEGPSTYYCIDLDALRRWKRCVATLFTNEEETERSLTMSSLESDNIRESVAARYGDRARQQLSTLTVLPTGLGAACCDTGAGAACCSTQECGGGYSAEDLAGFPTTVTGISLGCGNPVGLAGVQPGEVVLDLGSGGGIDCFLAARRTGEKGRVIGVDMTPDMVRLARANAEQVGLPNVEFRLGEIEHLPVDPESVDLVISNCVVNLAPDKAAVYREIGRVLKPGGRLVIADMVTDRPVPEALRARRELWSGCTSGALDLETHLATLREAGFDRIEVLAQEAAGRGDLGDIELSSVTLRGYKQG